MKIKAIIEEDYTNYKKPAMFIGTASCNGKCCSEAGLSLSVCQNDKWRSRSPFIIQDDEICKRYLSNPITEAIVFGGLEPFEQTDELISFVRTFRFVHGCKDDVVIYTGYYENEIAKEIETIRQFPNVILKVGRYVPGQESHYDDTLGVWLASDNQKGIKIS